MFKLILYWTLYSSSYNNIENKPIAGVITIDSTHVMTYLYPHQYVEWDIVSKDKDTYILEYNRIKSTLIVHPKYIEQIVFAPSIGYTDRIRVNRKR